MFATKQVYCTMLKDHFNGVFSSFGESEMIDGLQQHVSRIPYPFLNAVLGTCEEEAIEKRVEYFHEIGIPFDENNGIVYSHRLIISCYN